MQQRSRATSLSLLLVAGCACIALRSLGFGFMYTGLAPRTGVSGTRALSAPETQNQQQQQPVAEASSMRGGESLAGAAVAAGFLSVVVAGARRSVTARRVAQGSPSLIQLLEQKGLLSTVQDLKLLSTAESAGLGGSTLEKLGLLKLAEDLKLLSTAETIVTDGKTPLLLLAAGAALLYATYLDLTTLPPDFLQGFIAGALGLPGLLLAGAGLVLFALTAGARRTADISLTEKPMEYVSDNKWTYSEVTRDQTLLQTLEDRKLLSLAEELQLLSLAESVVGRPLTLAESTGILATLEKQGLLTLLESLAAKKTTGATIGFAGIALIAAAVVVGLVVGLAPGLLLGLGGAVLVGAGIVFTNTIGAPERSV